MDGLFLEILNLSLYGSFAIVAVLILRFLLKKKPQIHFLWFVAGGISGADSACADQNFIQPYACGGRKFSAGEAVSGSASGGKRHFCCG